MLAPNHDSFKDEVRPLEVFQMIILTLFFLFSVARGGRRKSELQSHEWSNDKMILRHHGKCLPWAVTVVQKLKGLLGANCTFLAQKLITT